MIFTRPDIVGHQCAQSLPVSTRLTAKPIWDKTKNKDFMKIAEFQNERSLARNDNPYVWYGGTSLPYVGQV